MKKLFAALLVLAMAIACFAGCAGETEQPTATPSDNTPVVTPVEKEVLSLSMMAGSVDAWPTEYMLEDWALKCTKVIATPPGNVSVDTIFQENMLLMFAGTDTPDWMPSWAFQWANPDEPFKEIGDAGKLVNFLDYEEEGKLDNYVNGVWGDALYMWDFCKSCLGSRATGGLYILPIRNFELAFYTWLYNSYYFDTELDMDAPPTDLAECIDIMKQYHAANPLNSAFLYDWGPSSGGAWGQWGYYEREPIFNACGVRHSADWYTHNGAPEYGPMAPGYLEAISAYRELMNEGVIFAQDQANVDSGKGQYASKSAALQNNGAIFSWEGIGTIRNMDAEAKKGNPDYEWAVVPQDPTFEGLSPVAYNNMPFGWDGKVIGTTASEALIERLVEFIDWTASPEGEMRAQFGIEGISYELVDGKVKFLKYYNDAYTPDLQQSNDLMSRLSYYCYGLGHKSNYDYIANLTVYESPTWTYQQTIYDKILGMIGRGECNYPGAWGSVDTAAQAVGETADSIAALETAFSTVVSTWRSAYYNNEGDDESYAQMVVDAKAAGYDKVLAYRWELLIDAMPKLAEKPAN